MELKVLRKCLRIFVGVGSDTFLQLRAIPLVSVLYFETPEIFFFFFRIGDSATRNHLKAL